VDHTYFISVLCYDYALLRYLKRLGSMSEEEKKLLEQQLWNIANALRGKMDADEFRDYILGG